MKKGSKHTPETRAKLIKMLNSYKNTDKFRKSHLASLKAQKGTKHNNTGWTKEVRERHSKLYKGKQRQITKEVREKIGLAHRGSKNVNWKGGISFKKQRDNLDYYEWRRSIFYRDKFTCRVCCIRSGCGKAVILNAHHIEPFRSAKDLRYDIDNGITLCKKCHIITHYKEHLFVTFFKGILENGLNSAETSQETTPSQQERLRKALWACVTVKGE
ncbi:MAG: HNH endonuclease [Thermoplasmata archaeon]